MPPAVCPLLLTSEESPGRISKEQTREDPLLHAFLFASQLVALDQSKLKGIVNTRRMMLNELGWEPEWEVGRGGVCMARTCQHAHGGVCDTNVPARTRWCAWQHGGAGTHTGAA
jgi:hypothetical protein